MAAEITAVVGNRMEGITADAGKSNWQLAIRQWQFAESEH
jgi:hypothetical protein